MELNPENEEAHKARIYQKVKSKIMTKSIECRFRTITLNKLRNHRNKFLWTEIHGKAFEDGLAMTTLVLRARNYYVKEGDELLKKKIELARMCLRTLSLWSDLAVER